MKTPSENEETPYLLMDLNVVRNRYQRLEDVLPMAKVYYAVKANPHKDVLCLLRDLGSCFDIASCYEMELLLSLGISAERMSYGNTIKKVSDIQHAFEQGLRDFSTDSREDLDNLAKHAPGSRVYFRISTDGLGADWPLSRKFGCHQDKVSRLALRAREIGLIPYGLTFHVGSQQRDIGQWDEGISRCRYLFSMLKDEGIYLKSINIGGGLPASYLETTPDVSLYAQEITRYLEEDFGDDMPDIIVEPGRYLVADAGTIVSEVVLISRKSTFDLTRWVYLDVGKFNGLIETLDELIKYPITTDYASDAACSPAILAGPTCDSMDILYETFKYDLPDDLKIGDKVYFSTAGAYTASYSSVGFNGFPPLKQFLKF